MPAAVPICRAARAGSSGYVDPRSVRDKDLFFFRTDRGFKPQEWEPRCRAVGDYTGVLARLTLADMDTYHDRYPGARCDSESLPLINTPRSN